MIEVRTTHGETHHGRSPQTIARRLYGPRAWVRVGSTVNIGIDGYAGATVLRGQWGDRGSEVIEEWLLDQDALDAAAKDSDQ